MSRLKTYRENRNPHYTEWAKSRYTVIIFFTGIVNDGREIKNRTKKTN